MEFFRKLYTIHKKVKSRTSESSVPVCETEHEVGRLTRLVVPGSDEDTSDTYLSHLVDEFLNVKTLGLVCVHPHSKHRKETQDLPEFLLQSL